MDIKIKLTKQANYNYYGVAQGASINLDIEEYLRGVVPSECYTSWSLAQVIASRSYAIVKYRRYGYVDDTTNSQAFNITNKMSKTTQAVDETAG